MMTSLTALPDEDAGDNRISFCIMINAVSGDLRGKQVDITIEPITESWVTTGENGDLVFHEGGTLTEAIRDHKWVFEDVMLDYPDQTIRLEPHVEVPYLDGTATLTKVEISPLNTLVRIEGGSCYDHHNRLEDLPCCGLQRHRGGHRGGRLHYHRATAPGRMPTGMTSSAGTP